jgi:hypothetical protein
MKACREENEVERTRMFLYFDRKICDALFDAKTKLQNADDILGNASICVYVKSIIVLCNVMGF